MSGNQEGSETLFDVPDEWLAPDPNYSPVITAIQFEKPTAHGTLRATVLISDVSASASGEFGDMIFEWTDEAGEMAIRYVESLGYVRVEPTDSHA